MNMRFSILLFAPLVAATVDEKVDRASRQLRRGNKAQLYNVAPPAPQNQVGKAVEDMNKAKEDEELWNRLLGEYTSSMEESTSPGWPWY